MDLSRPFPPGPSWHNLSCKYQDRYRRDVRLKRVLVEQDWAVIFCDHVEPAMESRVVGKTGTLLTTDDMPRSTDVVGDSTVIVTARRLQIPPQNLEAIGVACPPTIVFAKWVLHALL